MYTAVFLGGPQANTTKALQHPLPYYKFTVMPEFSLKVLADDYATKPLPIKIVEYQLMTRRDNRLYYEWVDDTPE